MAQIENMKPDVRLAQIAVEEAIRFGIPIKLAVLTSYPDDVWRLVIDLGEVSDVLHDMQRFKLSELIHNLKLKDTAYFDLKWQIISPLHPIAAALSKYHGIEPSNPKHVSVVFDGATFLEDPVILKAA